MPFKIKSKVFFHTRSKSGTGTIVGLYEKRGTWYIVKRPRSEGGGQVTVRGGQLRLMDGKK